MEMTISKILVGQLPRLKLNEPDLDAYEERNPYTPKYPVVDKATFLGIECEIENCNVLSHVPYWTTIKDGSLRNNGLEFVSLPLKATRVEQALHDLFTKRLYQGYTYSPRTSTHVHMNVRTLTTQQLKALVLTYMVVEKVLFNWVGNERDQNIYCVPLYNIQLTRDLIFKLDHIQDIHWMKYTALNLQPILSKGTIEFRHLHGTNNIELIMTWINFLLSLKKFALKNDSEYIIKRIYEMNTISDYGAFLDEVFGSMAPLLQYNKLHKDMSFCISHIKSNCFFIKQIKDNVKLNSLLGRESIPVIPVPGGGWKAVFTQTGGF